VQIRLQEESIPVCEDVRAACEILGLDPLYVANEGRFIAFVPPAAEATTLETLRATAATPEPRVIGQVISRGAGIVTMKNAYGVERIIDLHSGEQLPRIC
jgi:hydrogenase expression/formation protein HypE